MCTLPSSVYITMYTQTPYGINKNKQYAFGSQLGVHYEYHYDRDTLIIIYMYMYVVFKFCKKPAPAPHTKFKHRRNKKSGD